jgi:hypothetical protein
MLPNYDTSPYPVREDLAEAHRKAWRHLASPGTWLTGEQRVAIATEARHAAACGLCRDRKAALSPYAVEGAHDHLGALPENVVEVIHRVVTDPARLTESWVRKALASGIAETDYVETISVIAHTICVDTFTGAIGVPLHRLPVSEEGEPARVRPEGAVLARRLARASMHTSETRAPTSCGVLPLREIAQGGLSASAFRVMVT